jgi:hypothetical protein
MKKYFFVLGLLCIIAGCSYLQPFTDTQGIVHTKAGDVLTTVGSGMQSIGTFVPGYGTFFSLIGGLVAAIGGGITAVMSARKNAGALDAVIKGVMNADNEDVENKIKEVAGALGYEPYLNSKVKKIKGS